MKTVLIVDDSPLMQKIYATTFLGYRKCNLMYAKNGLDALNILSDMEDVDLIVLDINMPVMNGVQFLETIKKDGKHLNIPIIVITTEDNVGKAQQTLELGASAYLVKPFKMKELYETLDRIFV